MINNFKADPTLSSAHFNLKNKVIPDVEGDFSSLSGCFTFDPDNLSSCLIEAYIDVKSINSGSDSRNELLKSKDFFNVDKYPLIEFHSKNFEVFDEDVLKVTGNLKIKDITSEVVLNVERPDELKQKRISIAASVLVNRDEFKLDLGNVLEVGEALVGDNIQITMDIELIKQ